MGRISDRIQMNNPINPLDTSVTDNNQGSNLGTGRIRQRIQQNSEKVEEPESWGKWAARTALQIPKGIAQAKTWPLDAINALGYYDAVSDESIDDIRRASERLGKPFDEEAYRQSAENASSMFPTVSNLSRGLENNLGIPLEAKTGVQKFVNFASGASAMAPKDYTFRGMNTSLPKPVLGTGVAATAEAGKALGIPEPIADIGSFLILKKPTEGAGKISIGKKTKPSGLVERRFEDIDKNKKVSSGAIERINDKVEADVRRISNEIIETTPINETRKALQTDSGFKEKARDAFKKVSKIAEDLPGTMPVEKIQMDLIKKVMSRKQKGYTKTEYDKRYLKEIENILDSTKKNNISATDLVDEYRQNNKSLSEIYEPGKSFAENKAKRDAILEHNRVIAETIEKQYPNTEFSKLFKDTNKKWSEIMDAEAIDLFLHEIFEGKINFSKVGDFFEKEGMQKPFQRAMGEEGFGKFKILLNDLMSTEQAYKYIKAAQNSGANELANTMGAYMVSPALGKAKTLSKFAKGGFRAIYDFVLDKPKITITWDKAINAAKKGDFKTAEKEFAKVAEAEVQFSQNRKYNEKQIGRDGETIEVPKDERVQFRQKTLPNNQLKIENKKDALPNSKKGIEQKPKKLENEQYKISSQGEKLTPISTERKLPMPTEKKQIEYKPKAKAENKQEPISFTTEKGSKYTLNGNKTTRDKAYRKEHGTKEQGLQKESEKTFFVSGEDALKLSEFQTSGPSKRLYEFPDGRLGVMYESGPQKGKVSANTVVKYKTSPNVGDIPLEIWKNGEVAHFGNKITEITTGKPKILPKNVPAPKKVEPKKILTSAEKIGKLEKLKTQDISAKGLKAQKDFMTKELDKAIEYSSNNPGYTEGKALILDVPNDGTFNLKYDEIGLIKFRDQVEKIFPESPVKGEKYKTIPKSRPAKQQSKEYYRAKAEDIYKKEYAPLAVKIQELKKLKKDVKNEERELANILNQIENFKNLMDSAK